MRMGERAPRLALVAAKYSVRASIALWIVLAGVFWLGLALILAAAR
jgi:hypothetical protein